MAEAAEGYNKPELAELRLLTEAEHFLQHLDTQGNVPAGVFDAIVQNRTTAAQEIAMPYAVTQTEHKVITRETDTGSRERIILWLGRTALEVASSGYLHHFSEAAHKRVAVEESEAIYAQKNLKPGVVQVMISPKMTRHDADEKLAKAENLLSDDAIRTSVAVTDARGNVVGRKLQSLLVRHIPFEAWKEMLQAPDNIFGKAFDLRDERTALSVMELFEQMELPEDTLPEGPITLVEAVLPYITDELTRQKVKQQLKRFRSNQEVYANESKVAGKEWARFDLEIARSLQQGHTTDELRFFIVSNSNAWNDKALAIIEACALGDTQYEMTRELAALLARAKQKLIGDELSVATDNDRATAEVSAQALLEIKVTRQQISEAKAMGANQEYIRILEQRQHQLIQRQDIRSGGGCTGDVKNAFGDGTNGDQPNGVGEQASPFKSSAENKSSWQWKKGVCQVKSCPSPKPTEVGPCSVCRRCQGEFDRGHDPTKATPRATETSKAVGTTVLNFDLFRTPKSFSDKPPQIEKLLTAA